MYDIVRRLDKMSTGENGKIAPEVNAMCIIIEELTDRIERLSKECPTQWRPDEIEMNEKATQLRIKLDKVWGSVSPSDIGG